MISLIITIIVTVLLSSLAIGTGTKYLKESKSKDRSNFISVLSSAVSKRREDMNLNSNKYPYLGYHINNDVYFEQVIAPKVNESISYDDGDWYIVDTRSASSLGVRESEKYIDTFNFSGDGSGTITVALVNYKTGRIYLLNVLPSDISSLPESSYTPEGHVHRYIIENPTCTEPQKCIDCGYIYKEATGHIYSGDTSTPQPAVGDEANSHYERVCSVCGMPSGYAPHTFEYVFIIGSGPWKHKKKCNVCGYPEADDVNAENCSLAYTLPTLESEKEVYHKVTCKYCLHSANEPHDFGYREKSETMHEKYCKTPGCTYTVATEAHRDDDNNEICDDCNANIIDTTYPVLNVVTIVNMSATTEDKKYIATYGDTLKITVEANKSIQDLTVEISGMTAVDMTSADEKNWEVTYLLDKTKQTLSDGRIPFSVTCATKGSGVSVLAPITQPTDGKNVIFDGSNPVGGYVDKEDRVNEL